MTAMRNPGSSGGRLPGLRWLLGLGLLVGSLAALTVFCAAAIPDISALSAKQSELYDESYDRLKDALSQRWDPDDSITSASTGFDLNSSHGQAVQSWLVIEISYTGKCDTTRNDPCRTLANELARIVFDNYAHVGELTGIHVIFTNRSAIGPVSLSITPFDKALTIEEWRKELVLGQ